MGSDRAAQASLGAGVLKVVRDQANLGVGRVLELEVVGDAT